MINRKHPGIGRVKEAGAIPAEDASARASHRVRRGAGTMSAKDEGPFWSLMVAPAAALPPRIVRRAGAR